MMVHGLLDFDPEEFMEQAMFIDRLAATGCISGEEAADETRLLVFRDLDDLTGDATVDAL